MSRWYPWRTVFWLVWSAFAAGVTAGACAGYRIAGVPPKACVGGLPVVVTVDGGP